MPTTTTSEGTPLIAFRAGELLPELQARTGEGANPSPTARRDLDRYYRLLRVSLPRFTVAEASLIVDVLNGTLTEPHTASLLWASVADAIEDGYAQKWGVDGEALVRRLRALTPFEALAVADAAERFWQGPYRREGPMAETLRAVGLVK